MLKLLVLCLMVKATASTVEMDETEGSADIGDDEDYDVKRGSPNLNLEHTGKSRGDSEDGVTTTIIIVAVSTIVLILVVIGAIFLVKHYLHYMRNQHQGMYAVPAEQAQKGTI